MICRRKWPPTGGHFRRQTKCDPCTWFLFANDWWQPLEILDNPLFFPSDPRNRGSQGYYHCCGYKALTSWLMITECLALLKHWFLPHYPSSTHVRYVRTNPNGQFKFHRGQKLAKLPWHSDFREIWTLRLPQEKSYPVLQLTVLNARKCWGTLSEGNEMQQY